MARRESDADRQDPHVVPPEPWSETEEPAPETGADEQDSAVDEAFDWSRVQDEETPMPPPPSMSEEAPSVSPPPTEESESTTVEAPSWTNVEPVVAEPDVPEPPSAEETVAPEESEVEPTSPEDTDIDTASDVSRRRPLLSPEDLASISPAEMAPFRGLVVRPFGDEDVEPIDVEIDEPLRQEIAARVTRKQLNQLMLEVTELYNAVEEQVSSSKELSHEAMKKLNEARTLLMSQPGLFPVAELRIEQARVLLRRAENSERDADRYQLPIFLYNAVWLVALLALAVFDRALAIGLFNRGITPPFELPLVAENGREIGLTMAMYFAPWFCMIWGGIGGAIGSLYTLRTYVADREFDHEYIIHYFAHAPMGAVLGAVVYFLFISGFFVVGAVTQASDLTNPVQQVLTATSPLLILIALSFGLVQQAVYAMIDRVVRTVMGASEDEEDEEDTPVQPASTRLASGGTDEDTS